MREDINLGRFSLLKVCLSTLFNLLFLMCVNLSFQISERGFSTVQCCMLILNCAANESRSNQLLWFALFSQDETWLPSLLVTPRTFALCSTFLSTWSSITNLVGFTSNGFSCWHRSGSSFFNSIHFSMWVVIRSSILWPNVSSSITGIPWGDKEDITKSNTSSS